MKIRDLTLSALLVALAMGLSYIERFIPLHLLVPLPGIKLGLANVVTLVALYLLSTRQAMVILLLRCCLGALFAGSMTSLAYALAGGTLSFLAMALAKKTGRLSVYGVSVIGAAAHHIGQLTMAMILLGSVYARVYLPFLLLAAVPCGLMTGTMSAGCLRAAAAITGSRHRR